MINDYFVFASEVASAISPGAESSSTIVTDSVSGVAFPLILGGAALLAMASVRSSDVATRCRTCVDKIIEIREKHTKDNTVDFPQEIKVEVKILTDQADAFLDRYSDIGRSCVFFTLSITTSLLYVAIVKLFAHSEKASWYFGTSNNGLSFSFNDFIFLLVSGAFMGLGLYILIWEFNKGKDTLSANMKLIENLKLQSTNRKFDCIDSTQI